MPSPSRKSAETATENYFLYILGFLLLFGVPLWFLANYLLNNNNKSMSTRCHRDHHDDHDHDHEEEDYKQSK